ncbi:MAG: hypothetical protein HY718_11860 [Planctomycetes bacterium]|nr:hypothetical protein [Planctomycetota bacterium]
MEYGDTEAAEALLALLGDVPWEAVELARGYLALRQSGDVDAAAREVFRNRILTLTQSRTLIQRTMTEGFLAVLSPRTLMRSSENPITKLFPATITEQRFLELIDQLQRARADLQYSDDRASGHTLVDFTLMEGEHELPINIKNAGTRFESARQLVDLDPDDCVPIPAYKAYAAVETVPNLLYVVSVDYTLVSRINDLLATILSRQERIVWDLLTRFRGAHLRKAEDAFIQKTVLKYWDWIETRVACPPFHVASARKSIRVLQTKPHRTPGIGLRAWGNRANAEVNVHLSIRDDMTPWESVSLRILKSGLQDIIQAVNRRRQEWVYDPEI